MSKINYQKSIVTFIDILGFGDFVNRTKCKSVNRVLNAVEKATSPIKIDDLADKNVHAEVLCFSDSIVRVRKIDPDPKKQYPSGLFFQELINLVHAQGELIDLDIIIRGGVSIGGIYISESRVFGPGLIKAYELESKYAKYPRIIVDPELIYEYKTSPLLKAKWHSLKEDMEFTTRLLRQGDDGMWFVDYARAIESELDEPEMYPIFLKRHKEVILSGAKLHEKLNDVLSKFIWMACYHNLIVSKINDRWFAHHAAERSDLFINSKELPSLQYVEP